MAKNKPETFSRLRWRCRRGIREMDLLLDRFLDEQYPTLPDPERRLFEEMLDEADLDIYAWIMGTAEPGRAEYAPLIRRLRDLPAP